MVPGLPLRCPASLVLPKRLDSMSRSTFNTSKVKINCRFWHFWGVTLKFFNLKSVAVHFLGWHLTGHLKSAKLQIKNSPNTRNIDVTLISITVVVLRYWNRYMVWTKLVANQTCLCFHCYLHLTTSILLYVWICVTLYLFFLTSLMKVKQNALRKYMCITTKVYW